MAKQFIGQITSENGVGLNQWLAVMDTLSFLSKVEPAAKINPFSGKQIEFTAPDSTARILREGQDVGTISWAEDGSSALVVMAEQKFEEYVVFKANEVAQLLSSAVFNVG